MTGDVRYERYAFEYGEGLMDAMLPDNTDEFIPGETVKDPPCLPDPAAATREAILNPVGMEPLSKLAGPGKKVVIVFPDKVKGGFQETSHRKVSMKEYIDKYRFGYGYHPYHAFSMISCGHVAEMETSATYIVGARNPGYARAMGMKTRATFEEALADTAKYVGRNPNVLALPRTFKTMAVHLMMKDDVVE